MENKNGSLILFLFLAGSLAMLIIGGLYEAANPKKNPRESLRMMNPVEYSEKSFVLWSEGNISRMQSPFKEKR